MPPAPVDPAEFDAPTVGYSGTQGAGPVCDTDSSDFAGVSVASDAGEATAVHEPAPFRNEVLTAPESEVPEPEVPEPGLPASGLLEPELPEPGLSEPVSVAETDQQSGDPIAVPVSADRQEGEPIAMRADALPERHEPIEAGPLSGEAVGPEWEHTRPAYTLAGDLAGEPAAVPTVEVGAHEPDSGADDTAEALAAPAVVFESGPNWMLAFVCGWAGGFSLYQVGESLRRTDLIGLQRHLALGGFGALGVGLLLFALEALTWGRRREQAMRTALLLLPLVLTVIGLICLYLFHDPDPNKGRI